MKKTLPLFFLLLTCAGLWAQNNSRPAGACALFDGTKLDAWTNGPGSPVGWSISDGTLTCLPNSGSLTSQQAFADCQLHLESLGHVDGAVLLQGRYPVPLPAASVGPAATGWRSYDITYRAPRFNNDGSLKSPAVATVLRDGLLVRDHVDLKGSTAVPERPGYAKHPFKQPLVLLPRKDPVAFRNIWISELGVQQLLDGKDTAGWYSYLDKLGKNNDPEGNFKVENGLLHIEGKNFGYLATEQVHANYYLKVVFKWGEHQYAPRATGKRDSGILYHFGPEIPDKVWPKSIECQVQEGDCGDYWCVDGALIDSPNHSAIEWNMRRIYRTADFENPRGDWNTMEIICNGNQSEHYVNGHLVNAGTNANVASGKILLQSEGAEIYYRSVELIPY